MTRYNNQRGSTHAVVIIVLIAALIFALGWIFWQNFILKEPKTSNTKPVIVKQHDTTAATTKTYTDKASGVSFDYPGDWKVEPMNMDGSLMVTVKDSEGKPVAYLETKLSGLGGARAGAPENVLLASSKLTCAIASNVGSNSYELYYGTSDEALCSKTVGQSNSGGPVYMTTDTGGSKLGTLSFSNIDYLGSGKAPTFTSLDAAKQYVASDTFKQAQVMIDSLKY